MRKVEGNENACIFHYRSLHYGYNLGALTYILSVLLYTRREEDSSLDVHKGRPNRPFLARLLTSDAEQYALHSTEGSIRPTVAKIMHTSQVPHLS